MATYIVDQLCKLATFTMNALTYNWVTRRYFKLAFQFYI